MFIFHKKFSKIILLVYLFIPTQCVFANNTNILRHRLTEIHNFYADFIQNTTSSEGMLIQKNIGKIWIKLPNYFKLQMISPDESVLISDGKTLWFYNPFVEQVMISWLKEIINNTPLLLIVYNRNSDWKKFNVKRQGDNFILVPKLNLGSFNKAIINITSDGKIKSFSSFESNGLCNTYIFNYQNKKVINIDEFKLKLPLGITLDDQRN